MLKKSDIVRERILMAAVEALDAGGEGNVRVVAIAQEAGVTQGMISYYFGSRANLIVEAQATRFMVALAADTGVLADAVDSSSTVQEFRDAVEPIIRGLLEERRRDVRASRVAAFGAATSQPNLMATVSRAHESFVDGVERVVVRGQTKGLFVPDLDSRSVATMITGIAFGLFVSDVDPSRPSADALYPALFRAFDSLISTDRE
jgi:AcrR family transcriptional regulator